MVAYLTIAVAIFLFGLQSNDNYNKITVIECMSIIGIIACIFLGTSIHEINRFCKETSS